MSQIPFVQNGQFLGSVEVDPQRPNQCTHPKATQTGETCSDGCCDEYLCPDCGKKFWVEVPD